MIFFNHKEQYIQEKERQIQALNQKFHRTVDRDRVMIKRINKVLSNGITLEIYHATGGKNGR